MNKQAKSLIFLLITSIIWGFAFPFQDLATDHLANFSFNGSRFLLGALSLLPIIFIFERDFSDKKKNRRTFVWGIVVGFILFAASACQQWAILLMSDAGSADASGIVGFITGLYSVFVAISATLFFKEKLTSGTVIGVLLAAVGLFLIGLTGEGVSLPSSGELVGCGVAMIGTFFWTAHIITIDRKVGGVDPLKFSLVQFVTCALLNLACAPFIEPGVLTLANMRAAIWSVLFCGIMSVGVAYTCQSLGQKDANPAAAAIILSAECVFSAIGSIVIKGEFLPYWYNYLGAALIFGGIVFSQVVKGNPFKRKKRTAEK